MLPFQFPIEIWQEILELSEFLSQIRLTQVCQYFRLNLKVKDFCNIEGKYLTILDDNILKNYKHITKLNASHNSKIKKINHLTNLKILYARSDPYDCVYCGIDDNSLIDFNLIELDASYNLNIKNVNHMTNLSTLHAYHRYCGISNNGLKSLNLRKLFAFGNPKITPDGVKHMNNLKKTSFSDSSLYYKSLVPDLFNLSDLFE